MEGGETIYNFTSTALKKIIYYINPMRIWNFLCDHYNLFNAIHLSITEMWDPKCRQKKDVLDWVSGKSGVDLKDGAQLWERGDIICRLIRISVPEGDDTLDIADGYGSGWERAQRLASLHLGLRPVFTLADLKRQYSKRIERRLYKYVLAMRDAIKELKAREESDEETEDDEEEEDEDEDNCINRRVKFVKTRNFAMAYIARGIGLTYAYKRMRSLFYVYSSYGQSFDGIEIEIRGPSLEFASILIGETGSTLHKRNNVTLEYKLNDERLMVCFIPPSIGYYELMISKNGAQIPGSPFTIRVEEAPKGYKGKFGADSWFSEEGEDKVKLDQIQEKKCKPLTGIVDFVTEKMILTEDGKLWKIPLPGVPQVKTYSYSLDPWSDNFCTAPSSLTSMSASHYQNVSHRNFNESKPKLDEYIYIQHKQTTTNTRSQAFFDTESFFDPQKQMKDKENCATKSLKSNNLSVKKSHPTVKKTNFFNEWRLKLKHLDLIAIKGLSDLTKCILLIRNVIKKFRKEKLAIYFINAKPIEFILAKKKYVKNIRYMWKNGTFSLSHRKSKKLCHKKYSKSSKSATTTKSNASRDHHLLTFTLMGSKIHFQYVVNYLRKITRKVRNFDYLGKISTSPRKLKKQARCINEEIFHENLKCDSLRRTEPFLDPLIGNVFEIKEQKVTKSCGKEVASRHLGVKEELQLSSVINYKQNRVLRSYRSRSGMLTDKSLCNPVPSPIGDKKLSFIKNPNEFPSNDGMVKDMLNFFENFEVRSCKKNEGNHPLPSKELMKIQGPVLGPHIVHTNIDKSGKEVWSSRCTQKVELEYRCQKSAEKERMQSLFPDLTVSNKLTDECATQIENPVYFVEETSEKLSDLNITTPHTSQLPSNNNTILLETDAQAPHIVDTSEISSHRSDNSFPSESAIIRPSEISLENFNTVENISFNISNNSNKCIFDCSDETFNPCSSGDVHLLEKIDPAGNLSESKIHQNQEEYNFQYTDSEETLNSESKPASLFASDFSQWKLEEIFNCYAPGASVDLHSPEKHIQHYQEEEKFTAEENAFAVWEDIKSETLTVSDINPISEGNEPISKLDKENNTLLDFNNIPKINFTISTAEKFINSYKNEKHEKNDIFSESSISSEENFKDVGKIDSDIREHFETSSSDSFALENEYSLSEVNAKFETNFASSKRDKKENHNLGNLKQNNNDEASAYFSSYKLVKDFESLFDLTNSNCELLENISEPNVSLIFCGTPPMEANEIIPWEAEHKYKSLSEPENLSIQFPSWPSMTAFGPPSKIINENRLQTNPKPHKTENTEHGRQIIPSFDIENHSQYPFSASTNKLEIKKLDRGMSISLQTLPSERNTFKESEDVTTILKPPTDINESHKNPDPITPAVPINNNILNSSSSSEIYFNHFKDQKRYLGPRFSADINNDAGISNIIPEQLTQRKEHDLEVEESSSFHSNFKLHKSISQPQNLNEISPKLVSERKKLFNDMIDSYNKIKSKFRVPSGSTKRGNNSNKEASPKERTSSLKIEDKSEQMTENIQKPNASVKVKGKKNLEFLFLDTINNLDSHKPDEIGYINLFRSADDTHLLQLEKKISIYKKFNSFDDTLLPNLMPETITLMENSITVESNTNLNNEYSQKFAENSDSLTSDSENELSLNERRRKRKSKNTKYHQNTCMGLYTRSENSNHSLVKIEHYISNSFEFEFPHNLVTKWKEYWDNYLSNKLYEEYSHDSHRDSIIITGIVAQSKEVFERLSEQLSEQAYSTFHKQINNNKTNQIMKILESHSVVKEISSRRINSLVKSYERESEKQTRLSRTFKLIRVFETEKTVDSKPRKASCTIKNNTSDHSPQSSSNEQNYCEKIKRKLNLSNHEELTVKDNQVKEKIEDIEHKARFERAKIFFKELEESSISKQKPNPTVKLNNEKVNKFRSDQQNSEKSQNSDRLEHWNNYSPNENFILGPKYSYDSEPIDSEDHEMFCHKSSGISERFYVRELFNDIQEGLNHCGLPGIPNRAAVLASLRSIGGSSPNLVYEDHNFCTSYNYSDNSSDGYCKDYPYLPTTPPNKYKDRSNFRKHLISRDQLLNMSF